MKKVSIIIPIYNVSKYISRCIISVINQTYQNIECILVDDYSPDNSIDLVKGILDSEKSVINFKIIYHTKNEGLSSARNSGTKAATGDYLYYLDSDDEITPTCIEKLMSIVDKYPDIEMIQGNMKTIPSPPKSSDWRNIQNKNFPSYSNNNDWIRRNFYTSNVMKAIPMNATNKLIKYTFLVDNNLFFKKGILHEDELWMFTVVSKLNSIAFTKEYTYIAYSRQGSIMRSNNNYKSIQSWYLILKEVFKDINDPYFPFFKKRYVGRLYNEMCLINKNTTELDLYDLYRLLTKDILRRFFEKREILGLIPLLILLTPQSLYKSFLGRQTFKVCFNLCM